MLSLHNIHTPSPGNLDGAAPGSPLEAIMATNAMSQSLGLVEQLKQEEAALQERLAEIDAQQQNEQVGGGTQLSGTAPIL